MPQPQTPNGREQLRILGNCLAAMVLAVSVQALLAWAIPIRSNYEMLILAGLFSSIAYILGRRAIHTETKQLCLQDISTFGQASVLREENGALLRLLRGITEFKATIQSFSEDQHSPGGILLGILGTFLDGKDPKEEDLRLLSRFFYQFSIFSRATQPLDLSSYADMEADVQEALLRLHGQHALHTPQASQEHSGLDFQWGSLLHEVTPGLLPFDYTTVGMDMSLGTLNQKSGHNDTVREADEELPSLSTMLTKLASASASEYWQASRCSTEGSLWQQPSLQSALHVLQGSRLPTQNMSASSLSSPTSHSQPSSSPSPAVPFLQRVQTSFPSWSLHTEGRLKGIGSSLIAPATYNNRMAYGARLPVASAAGAFGDRRAISVKLSSSCGRAEKFMSEGTDSKPPVASDLSREPLHLLGEAAMHAKSRMSFSNPNMQALQSAASAELSGQILPGHAIIHCLSAHNNTSHFECTAESSSGLVQSSPACVCLQGTQVEGDEQEQYFLGKEARSKERSSANKHDVQGGTLKPSASEHGLILSPFGLGQVVESGGSKEGEVLGNEGENMLRSLDAGFEEEEQSCQKESQKHIDVQLHEEAGRVAGPQGPLVLEMEVALGHAYSSFSFDAFHLDEVTQGHPLSTLSYFLFHKSGLISRFKLHAFKLGRFLQTIEAGYSPLNPYHNAIHATDVLQTLHVILHHGWQNLQQADPLLHLAGYLAAVVHDFEHGGHTNDFLKNTHSRLAIRYNDTAPLENHHVAAAFDVLFTPGHNFLCNLPIYDYTRLRKAVIDLVLATDMKQHFHIVSLGKGIVQQPRTRKGSASLQPHDFSSMRYPCSRSPAHQSASSLVLRATASMRGPSSMSDCRALPRKSMEAETIRKKSSVPVDVKWSGRSSSESSSPSSPWKGLAAQISAPPALWDKESCLVHVSADPEKRLLLLQIALKCADLGHTAEDLDVHIRWVNLLEEEFWRQGDQEKAANLPLSLLFDRTKPGISKSQVGFFDVVALPLLKILVSAMPGALPLLTGAEHNYDHWKRTERQMQAQQQAREDGPA